jgi:ABC-type nitrate/sulfonate/bicarbonate transport system ATPase subunit
MAPSGIGKTTLLRCLLGLEVPDGGRIEGMPRRPAAVFQEDRLAPWLSVLENIRLVAPHVTEEEIQKTLAALGLAGEENTPAEALSGGMARRAAIARALLYGGDMLILDEPFSGLDEDTRAQTAACISEMAGDKTLLLVTHNEREAALLGAAILPDPFA